MTLTEAFKRRIFGQNIELVEINGEVHVAYDSIVVRHDGRKLVVEVCQGQMVVAQFDKNISLDFSTCVTVNGITGSIKATL